MARTRIVVCGNADWKKLPRKTKKELTQLMRRTMERMEKDDKAHRVREAA